MKGSNGMRFALVALSLLFPAIAFAQINPITSTNIAATGNGTGLLGTYMFQMSDNVSVLPGCTVPSECQPDISTGGNWLMYNGAVLNYHAGGSNVTGNRGGVIINMWVDKPPSPSETTGGYYQPLYLSAYTNINLGGTAEAPKGFLYSYGAQALVGSGATHIHSVAGQQQDIGTASQVQTKSVYLGTVQQIDSVQAATDYDVGFHLGASYRQNPVGLKCAFCISDLGNGAGQGPLGTNGTLLGAIHLHDFANVIDVEASNVRNHVFKLSAAQKILAATDLGVPSFAGHNVFINTNDILVGNARGIGIYSQNIAQYASMVLGRVSDEAYVAVVGSLNQFIVGTTAGDLAIRNDNNIVLGGGSLMGLKVRNGQVFAPNLTSGGATGKFVCASSSGELTVSVVACN